MIYGHDKTWHRTEHVSVEVHNGKVVAVWFRCMLLPFKVHEVSFERREEMERMCAENKPWPLLAVELQEPESKPKGEKA